MGHWDPFDVKRGDKKAEQIAGLYGMKLAEVILVPVELSTAGRAGRIKLATAFLTSYSHLIAQFSKARDECIKKVNDRRKEIAKKRPMIDNAERKYRNPIL